MEQDPTEKRLLDEELGRWLGPEGEDMEEEISHDAPVCIFVQFPTKMDIAFNVNSLSPDEEPTFHDVKLPESYFEPEVADGSIFRNRLSRVAEFLENDLQKKKRVFMLFLGFDILFCCMLLAMTAAGTGGVKSITAESFYSSIAILLLVNIFVDFLTIFAIIHDSLWLLNLFILVEAASITVFIIRTFSPIVVLRLVVLLLACQIRGMMLRVRQYRTELSWGEE